MFALVDCNSCYASCEQIFRPDLRNKPIVVLSNNDGCIVTRSKEAKDLNIPNFEAFFKLKPLLSKNNVHVFSSNYELYGDISSRIMRLLNSFTPHMEIYSIDEAFLDVGGMSNLAVYANDIKRACWKQHRMPVCVGVGKTKTLAKLANHIAKKSHKLEGVAVIKDINQWTNVFKKIPVSQVWGVGSRINKRLETLGVYSVQDLRDQNPKAMRKDFGVTLERTIRELNGEVCHSLELEPAPKKEIFCSRSFSEKITSLAEIEESVANYTVRACEKLRRQKSLTRQIYVTIQTSRFNELRYSNSLSTEIEYPTNDTRLILQKTSQLTRQLYKPGYRYAQAGVGLLDLSVRENQQTDLFTEGQSKSSIKTMQVIDSINKKYGKGEVFFGSQGIQRKWSMSRQYKSPAYTTRIKDLPIVKL